MSASNAAAEPSMEEILSSIRQAINEDIPGAVPESAGDPFASGSSAEAAFASPPPGQAFDAAVHGSHDPFAELTRKLNETRESVQKQMHGVSSNLRSEQADAAPQEAPNTEVQTAPPAPELPEEQAPSPQETAASTPAMQDAQPIRAETFSTAPEETSQIEPKNGLAAADSLQSLTARVVDQQRNSAEPPKPDLPSDLAETAPTKQIEVPPVSGGNTKPQMPELSWTSAERSVPAQASPIEAPEAPRAAAIDAPIAPAAATAPKPKADIDPFPKLTAIVERGASENSSSSAKTDDAMVDLVLRRILEPAVKSWLDDNLPKIVTEVVREEVRRVANQSN